MNKYILNIENILQKSFSLGLADIAQSVQSINPLVKVAIKAADVSKIISIRQEIYSNCYPESQVNTLDKYDYSSLLLFSEDDDGKVMGTCRLVLDTETGFLEDNTYKKYITEYRNQGKLLSEWGRCIVTDKSLVRAFDFADVIKSIASDLGIEYVLLFSRQCDVPRVLRKLDSKVLIETDKDFGSRHKFTAVLWNIPQKHNIYESRIWDGYARSFLTVTTKFQTNLLIESSQHLSGNVVDCGSGCAKMAPYLKYKQDVTSYTAIDASPDMCQLGQHLLDKLNKDEFQIIESYIEDWKTKILYDSAVSINSLYTWTNPLAVLKNIHAMLKLDGIFVLASINKKIDIPLLIEGCKADLLMHPDFDNFCEINLQIDGNSEANRYSLDELIQLVHQAGFKLVQCHDRLFEGGLNFMVLKK